MIKNKILFIFYILLSYMGTLTILLAENNIVDTLEANIYELNLNGANSKLLDESFAIISKIEKKAPLTIDKNTIDIFKGGFYLILARDSWNIFMKYSYLEKGVALLQSIDLNAKINTRSILRLIVVKGLLLYYIPKNKPATGNTATGNIKACPTFCKAENPFMETPLKKNKLNKIYYN